MGQGAWKGAFVAPFLFASISCAKARDAAFQGDFG